MEWKSTNRVIWETTKAVLKNIWNISYFSINKPKSLQFYIKSFIKYFKQEIQDKSCFQKEAYLFAMVTHTSKAPSTVTFFLDSEPNVLKIYKNSKLKISLKLRKKRTFLVIFKHCDLSRLKIDLQSMWKMLMKAMKV